MIVWSVQITILSIILIYLVHHILSFFKSTLTTPKIKDWVNTPIQKYDNMYTSMNDSNNSSTSINNLTETYSSSPMENIVPATLDTLGAPNFQNNPPPNNNNNNNNIDMPSYGGNNTNKQDMKNDLKKYLKKQLSEGPPNIPNNQGTTNIAQLDSMSHMNYSQSY